MALLPKTPNIFDDLWKDVDRQQRWIERHLGLCKWDDFPSLRRLRPWRRSYDDAPGSATIESLPDKFRTVVDVQQFSPYEIKVRTVDNTIVVEAKHDEKKDIHGYVTREFVRRYHLPKGYDIWGVNVSLSSDGFLTITAPRLVLLPAPGERTIPINRTYRPAIRA